MPTLDRFGHPIIKDSIVLVPMRVLHVHDDNNPASVLLLQPTQPDDQKLHRVHYPTIHLISRSVYLAHQGPTLPEAPEEMFRQETELAASFPNGLPAVPEPVDVLAHELTNPTRFGRVWIPENPPQSHQQYEWMLNNILIIGHEPWIGGTMLMATSTMFDESPKEKCPVYDIVTTMTAGTADHDGGPVYSFQRRP